MSELRFPRKETRARLDRSGPWPGPVPYTEGDHQHYRGRSRELNRIHRMIGVRDLIMLTGLSGTGKTSLLQAGVIPKLRTERAQAVLQDRKTAVPAVLVVRDWVTVGHGKGQDHHEILKGAITKSIETLGSEVVKAYKANEYRDIRKTIRADYRDMSGIAEEAKEGTTYQYVSALAQAVGSLLLCVDQFEEALQGSNKQRKEILDTIAGLVKQRNHRIKAILSFRHEFSSLFRGLDEKFGNLSLATVFLEPMPETEVRDAIKEAADSGGVSLHEDALNKLLDWMRRREQEDDAEPSISVKKGETTLPETLAEPSVDLLRLQALLWELYLRAASAPPKETLVTISKRTLERLLEQERSEYPELNLTGPRLMQSSLRMFIERRVLPLTLTEAGPASGRGSRISAATGLSPHSKEIDEGRLMRTLLQRRIAARMAPFFSSLGLKVQQHEAHLVASALREEWRVLEQSPEAIQRLIARVGLNGASSNLRLLGLGRRWIDRQAPILSGSLMRSRQRSYSTAVKYLLDACSATLDQFADASINVLRPKTTQQGTVYELVHDGFGPALDAWSEHVRSDPLDALGAITAQRGESYYWQKLGGSVRQVCWRGCWIGPDTDGGVLEFDNVEWSDCDLRGTLFDRCHFNGGVFEGCGLDGVIFRNCTFSRSSVTGKPFAFRHIDTYGLNFFGGSLTNVDFEDCSLRQMLWSFGPKQEMERLRVSDVNLTHCQLLYQWSIEPAALIREGPLGMDDCALSLCDLRGLLGDRDRDEPGMEIRRCTFSYCLVGALASVIDDSEETERYPIVEEVPG